jgi:hypothetical protein
MGRACSKNGAKTNAYGIFVGEPKRKRSLGRLRHKWVENIKKDLI